MRNNDETRGSYDRVAGEYARRIAGELDGKPFDRAQLDRLASATRPGGIVADLGGGTCHVGGYLRDRGARVCGVDLSHGMLREAARLNPGMALLQADMRSLPVRDGAWAGVAAFYSLIHVPREQMVATLQGIARALEPGGTLLAAFHIGDETIHLDDWWERKVCLDFHFIRPEEMRGWLEAAGFEIEEVLERDPYAPEVEHQSRRCYVFARSPGPAARSRSRSGQEV